MSLFSPLSWWFIVPLKSYHSPPTPGHTCQPAARLKTAICKLQPPGPAVLSSSFWALDRGGALSECEGRSVKGEVWRAGREGGVFSLPLCQTLVPPWAPSSVTQHPRWAPLSSDHSAGGVLGPAHPVTFVSPGPRTTEASAVNTSQGLLHLIFSLPCPQCELRVEL